MIVRMVVWMIMIMVMVIMSMIMMYMLGLLALIGKAIDELNCY